MQEIYFLAMIFLSLCLYYMLKNRLAIFFPSFPGMVRIIGRLADIQKSDLVYDLGSGDGRVLEVFAKKGVECIGIEQNGLLIKAAKKRLKKYKNVRLIHGNIFDQSLSKADVIIAYLSRYATRDLQKKIKKECRKGTRIILVSYRFDGWEPVRMKKWFWLGVRLYVK
ncbi:MAG: hypothetical protein COY38_00950 [Candidatus Aenigmarchaeota archaeon CG_4_10_14_0_8_um_filter_37_24]|nr:methyltransferase domain-containing protein [Candidatus Aenigmarchaeota archaeon]OIN85751.1 MAG: hypothetical protein AUJ50_04645 [Candidatus Aenigmarchaeota archaeon CG1_02_38_14]PIV68604.1 MAG: hypothetical protein COS07_03550 [Candidatus Aenigmarchaeota archaeon CG01_land_8_20_14_3_00_37_9]PIW41103.1 MAG: hypothetical protein COW21_03590 [Candidatus Aenigmarchaeota archaeon CG15_BIG_FIL_POST_REV_8_21_14_020_37_27]PIX50892.1 MAG: hypothetical protein COZ52_01690 [Candidatus Aenigmarchaeota